MVQPNFLLIGAQRSGTTWLWHQFKQHPEVFVATRKELEFFSYVENLDEVHWRDYCQNFEAGRDLAWRGECTPSYFMTTDDKSPWHSAIRGFNREIPRDIRRFLGSDIRLFLSLRHPVERAVSAYFHHARHGRVEGGRGILDAGHTKNLIDAGFYGRHLEKWLEHFGLDQFFICTTDEIQHTSATVLQSIQQFLGLSKPFPPASMTGKNTGWRLIRLGNSLRPLRRPFSGIKVTRSDLERLNDIYRDDIERLHDILGRRIFEDGPYWT